MKTILLILLLMCGSASAAIVYYDSYPNNANPPNTFIMSIQTLDKSAGGVPYNYMTLSQLANWLGVSQFTNGGMIIITNASFQFITNLYAYITNLYSTNITSQNIFTTNLTITVPGGSTNLNLTPNTVMYVDGGDAEASVPNGLGVFTNDSSGGVGWTMSLRLDELSATNFYPANTFIDLTNSPYLATDGNGQVILGTGLSPTNITLVSGANISFTTNGDGSVTIATSGVITGSLAASNIFNGGLVTPGALDLIRATNNDANSTNFALLIGANGTNNDSNGTNFTLLIGSNATNSDQLFGVNATNHDWVIGANATNSDQLFGVNATNNDANGTNFTLLKAGNATNEVTRQINSGTNIYTPLGSALSGIESATNLSYIVKTNNGGGNALVAGSPGTALTCILTNITAATTLGAMTFWTAGMSVIPVYASCSGGTDRALKFPANFQGSGDLYGIDLNGTGVTITNGEARWFEVRCIYGVKTNVFTSATK